MEGHFNADAVRLVKPYVDKAIKDALGDFIVIGSTPPSSAGKVGQLFLRTGTTDPGLYVSTGTTTPGWKAVSHAE